MFEEEEENMRWKTDAEMRRASPSLPVVVFSARERSIVQCYGEKDCWEGFCANDKCWQASSA